MQKAVTALQQGRLPEAATLLGRICKSSPGDARAWLLLASAQGQLGNLPAALDACRRALAINPGNARALSIQCNVQASLGQTDAALESYRKALEIAPGDPGILNNLGNALFLAGDLEEAARVLEQLIRLKPDYAEACNNLGNIHKALNRNNEAIQHFRRSITLNPGQFEVWLNLGNIYSDRVGFPEAAEECFRKALQLKPDSREAESGLANMLRFQGKLDASLAIMQKALDKDPADDTAMAGIADILERLGRYEEAYERVRTLLDRNTENAMAIDVLTRLCRRFDCCGEAIDIGERLLASDCLNPHGQQHLHFSLGKLLDKLAEYDRAFGHFRTGNEMGHVPFDPLEREALTSALIGAYSRDALTTLPKASHQDQRPVFIVGMPRSGTSLTEQILASHPEVHGAGELNDMNDISAGLPGMLGGGLKYPECVANLNPQVVNQLAQRYIARLDGFSKEARRITDKMPHNFINLGLIALLFPQARIIHCRRDPRDNCLSIYFQDFGWLHPYASRLEHLGHSYRQYQRIMRHWRTVLEVPMLDVPYEDLVADPEGISRGIVDYCGLDWDDRCLQFQESGRTVATASYDQVRQPIYTGSLGRWKNYERHIGPLIEALAPAQPETAIH